MIFKVLVVAVSVYLLDVTLREWTVSRRAKRLALKTGKPMLNVGSGTATSSATGAKLRGDVNCDIAAAKSAPSGPNQVCYCDVQSMPQFQDKQFGVALAVNVLPYVPDRARAEAELHRVADHVITSDNFLPWPQIGPGPLFPVRQSLREER